MGSSRQVARSAHIINDVTQYLNLCTNNEYIVNYSRSKRSNIPLMKDLSEGYNKTLKTTK